jgi:hypothetical protein
VYIFEGLTYRIHLQSFRTHVQHPAGTLDVPAFFYLFFSAYASSFSSSSCVSSFFLSIHHPFQHLQVKSARAARKVMGSKGLAHYWDMVAVGDKLDHAAALFA